MGAPPETAASVASVLPQRLGNLPFQAATNQSTAFDAGQTPDSFFRRHCHILAMMGNGQQPKEKR